MVSQTGYLQTSQPKAYFRPHLVSRGHRKTKKSKNFFVFLDDTIYIIPLQATCGKPKEQK